MSSIVVQNRKGYNGKQGRTLTPRRAPCGVPRRRSSTITCTAQVTTHKPHTANINTGGSQKNNRVILFCLSIPFSGASITVQKPVNGIIKWHRSILEPLRILPQKGHELVTGGSDFAEIQTSDRPGGGQIAAI